MSFRGGIDEERGAGNAELRRRLRTQSEEGGRGSGPKD